MRCRRYKHENGDRGVFDDDMVNEYSQFDTELIETRLDACSKKISATKAVGAQRKTVSQRNAVKAIDYHDKNQVDTKGDENCKKVRKYKGLNVLKKFNQTTRGSYSSELKRSTSMEDFLLNTLKSKAIESRHLT